MSFTENWMGGINDFRHLNDIIMPGSHDSGMSSIAMEDQIDRKVLWKSGVHYAAGRTQDLNVYQQCNAGVRFFDVRIANSYISREGKKHYE